MSTPVAPADLTVLIQGEKVDELREVLSAPGAKKLLNRSSADGEYPIHLAARLKKDKVVELLLAMGANPNQESEEKGNHLGYTAAHHAATNGDLETLQILCNHKVDFNRGAADKWTPLHVAAFKGRLNAMRFLVEHGANVNCLNNFDQPPILFAVNHGRAREVRFLIKSKADLKYKDLNQETLLHHAFHFQLSKMLGGQYRVPEAQLDVGVLLTLSGVQPTEKNIDGLDATHYIKASMPSLPETLVMLFGLRDKLAANAIELNYLSLVSAKADELVRLGLSDDEAAALATAMANLDKERLSLEKGRSAEGSKDLTEKLNDVAGGEAAMADAAGHTQTIDGVSLPAGHAFVSPDQLVSGEDPSNGKCPFFQRRKRQQERAEGSAAAAPVTDDNKPLCPFSWAYVRRHQTVILMSVTSFVLGMWTDQMLDRVFPRK